MNFNKTTPTQASAIAAIAVALVILGPAANHANAGPITELLMWATLAAGLLMLWLGRADAGSKSQETE